MCYLDIRIDKNKSKLVNVYCLACFIFQYFEVRTRNRSNVLSVSLALCTYIHEKNDCSANEV